MNYLNNKVRSLRQSIEVIKIKLNNDMSDKDRQELLNKKEILENELKECLKKL